MDVPQSSILSLNRSRQRAVYYRLAQDGTWVPTKPLPADPQSIAYYFAKGFKAKPPDEGEKPADVLKCPLCDFEPQSVFGLQSHLRKHIPKLDKEQKEE